MKLPYNKQDVSLTGMEFHYLEKVQNAESCMLYCEVIQIQLEDHPTTIPPE